MHEERQVGFTPPVIVYRRSVLNWEQEARLGLGREAFCMKNDRWALRYQ